MKDTSMDDAFKRDRRRLNDSFDEKLSNINRQIFKEEMKSDVKDQLGVKDQEIHQAKMQVLEEDRKHSEDTRRQAKVDLNHQEERIKQQSKDMDE